IQCIETIILRNGWMHGNTDNTVGSRFFPNIVFNIFKQILGIKFCKSGHVQVAIFLFFIHHKKCMYLCNKQNTYQQMAPLQMLPQNDESQGESDIPNDRVKKMDPAEIKRIEYHEAIFQRSQPFPIPSGIPK